MRVDATLQKLEVYVVAAVAAILVLVISFSLSTPFSPQHYGLTEAPQTSPATSSVDVQESQPALLEPALRTLDGVAHHG
jgi:hypothetical protein